MLRTIIWYLYFPISLIARIPALKRMEKKKGTVSEDEFVSEINQIARKWSKSLVDLTGATITIRGEENIPKEEAVLFVSNHQSNFDIAIFLSHIHKDKGFISKIEVGKIPFLKTWMTYLNCVFMDRKDLKSSGKAIIDGIQILKRGYSLVVFPEGTRSKGSQMGQFKSASLKLATKSKVPIVPVTIQGTYLLMEANNNKIKPAQVTFTIHPAIPTADLEKNSEEVLCEQVVSVIRSAL